MLLIRHRSKSAKNKIKSYLLHLEDGSVDFWQLSMAATLYHDVKLASTATVSHFT